jgi:Heavy metal binding domain
MDQMQSSTAMYSCPMHSDVRQPTPGKCTKCGMDLIAEGTRFRLLRHMTSSPLHIAIMAALMLAVMAAVMMMMRGIGP